jgi:hypothetical protein
MSEPVAPGVYTVPGITVHGYRLSTILLVALLLYMIARNRKGGRGGGGWS